MPSREGIFVFNMKQIIYKTYKAEVQEINNSHFLVSTIFFDFQISPKELSLFSSRLIQEINSCLLQGGTLIKKGNDFLQYSTCSLTISKAHTQKEQIQIELRFTDTPGGKTLKEIAIHRIDLNLHVQLCVTKQNNIYKNISLHKFDIVL